MGALDPQKFSPAKFFPQNVLDTKISRFTVCSKSCMLVVLVNYILHHHSHSFLLVSVKILTNGVFPPAMHTAVHGLCMQWGICHMTFGAENVQSYNQAAHFVAFRIPNHHTHMDRLLVLQVCV